jgi:hypothetical protein
MNEEMKTFNKNYYKNYFNDEKNRDLIATMNFKIIIFSDRARSPAAQEIRNGNP